MARYELTEFESKTIQPLLPNKPRGVPRFDGRRVLNVGLRDFAFRLTLVGSTKAQ
jgi:transposase